MADRCDYHFRQKVTEAELDLAFELLERADRNLAADLGIHGIIGGAVPSQHAPVPDLTIDLSAPVRAYDHLGQRVFYGTGQVVDCSADLVGIPTQVTGAGQERWLGVFLKFDRLLSDPRTDGNSQQVFFRRDESFQVVVRQGPEGPPAGAQRVALQDDELLLCDIRRTFGQAQVLNADIDTSRRQAFIFATGSAIAIVSGLWTILQPAVNTVQAALDEVDAELAGHFGGTARRHPSEHVDYPPHGFVAANTVRGALDEMVDDLSSAVAGNPGAQRVGADAVAGAPNALPAGNVDGQLSQLLAWLNAHVSAAAGAHNASAIAAAVHSYISATSVQAQLQEIVTDLQSQSAGVGASQIGNNAAAGAPNSLAAGTVRDQLVALLGQINAHLTAAAAAHAATAISAAAHNFVSSTNVQAQLEEIVDDLQSQGAGVGASQIGNNAAAGAPNSLAAGTVRDQLVALLGQINAHLTAAAAAHAASAVVAAAHNYVSSTSVQAQLEEIVDDLQSQGAGLGASQVGNNAMAGAPYSAAAGTVRDQLVALLAALNGHTSSGDHDARYYNVGESVGNADTVDGQHASAFATAGHDHDDRYLRRVYTTQVLMDPGTSQVITTQAEQPDLVSVSYNYPDASTGLPQATTYARGALTSDIRYWITKLDLGGGNKDYRITVSNDSTSQLWINVAVHRRD